MPDPIAVTPDPTPLLSRCLSVDLEVDPKTARLFAFAAVRGGALRVIAATNAFGMGIDKPDIRLVVHGDIPGSLENYLLEAGRAGRDRALASCVLLFAPDDVERQFSLSARSRLARHEIGAILKALRRLDARMKSGIVVATPGEIVREEKDRAFERDSATDARRRFAAAQPSGLCRTGPQAGGPVVRRSPGL